MVQLRRTDRSFNRVVFTLVTFNDDVKFKIVGADLSQVSPVTEHDYHPEGGTALFDALGTCIHRFENQTRVIMVIATDGKENRSTNFTQHRVKEMIAHCTDQLGWQLMFTSVRIWSLCEKGKLWE